MNNNNDKISVLYLYCIYDRLSNRHDWLMITHRETLEQAINLIKWQIDSFSKWSKREKYPNYQLAYKIIEQVDYDNKPSNYKMDKIFVAEELQKLLQEYKEKFLS